MNNYMKKITITNAYTWYNKGDAGILLGIVETLKKIYKDEVSIYVLSFTPEEDKIRYCKDHTIKNVYSNVLNPHPYKHTKLGKINAIIKLIFSMLYQLVLVNTSKKKLVNKYENYRSLNESDYIVVCGGGFLGGRKFDSFMHLFQIYINTKFGKKVIMMGTSIEPITNKFVKRMTERIIKKVDYIYAREVITYEYLKEFMPENKFELIPDMAFMLEDVKEELEYVNELKKGFKQVYGLTVRKWDFPEEKNGKELFEKYKNELARFIEYKAKKDNSLFVFVPQVIVEHGNDANVAKEIKNLMKDKYKNNFVILEDDIHPTEIKQLIWNFDFFIGTRMHSNIFATSMGVPTIAIAYEKKTNGIMHTVELDDYVLEMNSITRDKLKKISDKQLVERKKIENHLSKKIVLIRKEIFNKIKDKLEEL